MKYLTLTALLLVILFLTNLQASSTIHVDHRANGLNNGTSWGNAYSDLRTALEQAVSGDELWIAQGTYFVNDGVESTKPDTLFFEIKEGVNVYGSFYGNETTISARSLTDINRDGKINDWEFASPTIISGDIFQNDNSANFDKHLDNAQLLLKSSNMTLITIWNGITLTSAYSKKNPSIDLSLNTVLENSIVKRCYANVESSYVIRSKGTIHSTLFEDNTSEGRYLIASYQSVSTVIIRNNESNYACIKNLGGAIDNCEVTNNQSVGIENTQGTVRNCKINGNTKGGIYNRGILAYSRIYNNTVDRDISHSLDGAGVENIGLMINCTVFNNYTYNNFFYFHAGGVVNERGTMINCTVCRNKFDGSQQGAAGVYQKKGSLINCVIWNNEGSSGYGTPPDLYIDGQHGADEIHILNTAFFTYEEFGQRAEYDQIIINPSNDLTQFTSGSKIWGAAKNLQEANSLDTVSWSIGSNSLLIDKGDPLVGTLFDISGLLRDSIPDLGAQEYNGQPLTFNDNITPNAEGIIFVATEGNGNGSSWEQATPHFQSAIQHEKSKEVWVKNGTYLPPVSHTDNYTQKDRAFIMKEGVNVYGGFLGNENSIEERVRIDTDNNGVISPWEYANETILSGDIDQNDTLDNNSIGSNALHVILQKENFETETNWDGFTITKGNANSLPSYEGGGIKMKKNSILKNSQVMKCSASQGGGIYNEYGTIDNCLVYDNYLNSNGRYRSGGGIFNYSGNINDCIIHSNTSSHENTQGGGIYSNNGTINGTQCYNNLLSGANSDGAGILNYYGKVLSSLVFNNECSAENSEAAGIYNNRGILKNVTVSNNKLSGNNSKAAGLSNNDGESYNSIIWGNTNNSNPDQINAKYDSLFSCAIQDETIPYGNNFILSAANEKEENNDALMITPGFITLTEYTGVATTPEELNQLHLSNWKLAEDSECIDKGNNQYLNDEMAMDLNGFNRIFNDIVDLGASEYALFAPFIVLDDELSVYERDQFTINAESSYTLNNDLLTASWIAPESFELHETNGLSATYTAPDTDAEKSYYIKLKLENSYASSIDSIAVHVLNMVGNKQLPEQTEIIIYPNPVENDLHIVIEAFERSAATLYSIAGKEIKLYKTLTPGVNKVELNGIQKGIYILSITNQHYSYKEKIIIQ